MALFYQRKLFPSVTFSQSKKMAQRRRVKPPEKRLRMSQKDWFDDYMDCKLSGNNSGKKPTDSSGCLPCILGVLAVLWLITTLFG
jgi:hypothetical protein